jgi:tRNA threonylcarbamoyladenosine biosynthesis protein TsaB
MIINIDTTSPHCSLALSEGTSTKLMLKATRPMLQLEQIGTLTKHLLAESGIKAIELEAVALSAGPGSYTGLRIGMAFAKGFSFAANLPLICLDSLHILAHAFSKEHTLTPNQTIRPMIDARRMEVYSALFDYKGNFIEKSQPIILTDWHGDTQKTECVIIGNGISKVDELSFGSHYRKHDFREIDASDMAELAHISFSEKHFADLQTVEPIYLKPVFVTAPKNYS